MQAAVTLAAATVLVFVLLHAIPGGPFHNLLGETVGADPAAAERAEALLGLDRPPSERYVSWVSAVLGADLGTSWVVAPGRPVGPLIWSALGHTLLLTGVAFAIALALGGNIGVASALRPGSRTDFLLSVTSLVVGGVPTFWLGMLALIVFAVHLAWLPAGGAQTIGRSDLADRLTYLVLPVLTLATVQVAAWGRYVRAALLEHLGQDYLRTARAKGLSNATILLRHALPNALPPLIALVGLEVPALVAGATVTEAVFNYPGLGRLLLAALRAYDWPLVQGIALVLAISVVLASVLADVAVALCTPRLRA